jgi:hypothetical protein
VCVGRHHCWAAGPLGLGFPVSLYIVVLLYAIHQGLHCSTWYQPRFRVFPPPFPLQSPAALSHPAVASHLSRRRPREAPPPSRGGPFHWRGCARAPLLPSLPGAARSTRSQRRPGTQRPRPTARSSCRPRRQDEAPSRRRTESAALPAQGARAATPRPTPAQEPEAPPDITPGTMAGADAGEPVLAFSFLFSLPPSLSIRRPRPPCTSPRRASAPPRRRPGRGRGRHSRGIHTPPHRASAPPRDCCLPPHRRCPTGSGTGGPSPAYGPRPRSSAAALHRRGRPSSSPPQAPPLYSRARPMAPPRRLRTPRAAPPAFLRAAATRSAPQPSYASCAPLPPMRNAPGLPVRPARAALLIVLAT